MAGYRKLIGYLAGGRVGFHCFPGWAQVMLSGVFPICAEYQFCVENHPFTTENLKTVNNTVILITQYFILEFNLQRSVKVRSFSISFEQKANNLLTLPYTN